MISYEQFWETLKKSDQTTYTLIKTHHISSATIHKLRRNRPITTTTINDLCKILDCSVEEILTYTPSDDDQSL
ncbi:MAG: helix-turn-helix transcriptional regulator [Eubacterium sp.]|nr:helix-turn-helix transcriptional regulator [Eubacterium sp.]